MEHKHKQLIDIWTSHTELEIEVLNRDCKWQKIINNSPSWDGENYQFAIPNDSDGNPVEMGKSYFYNEPTKTFAAVIKEINQNDAEISLLRLCDRAERIIKFWNSNILVPMKEEDEQDKFSDFPGVVFREIFTKGSFDKIEDETLACKVKGGEIHLWYAISQPHFIGYGYELPDGIDISSAPVMYLKDGGAFNALHNFKDGTTALRPKWVCFREEK